MAPLITDPICFKRTDDGDLLFPLELARGLEAVAIGIRTRLQLCRGEWFMDLDIGLPLLPTADGAVSESAAILGQAFDPIKTRAAFMREILSVPGVFDVPTFRMNFDGPTRVLSITWVAQTQYGETPLDNLTLEI